MRLRGSNGHTQVQSRRFMIPGKDPLGIIPMNPANKLLYSLLRTLDQLAIGIMRPGTFSPLIREFIRGYDPGILTLLSLHLSPGTFKHRVDFLLICDLNW